MSDCSKALCVKVETAINMQLLVWQALPPPRLPPPPSPSPNEPLGVRDHFKPNSEFPTAPSTRQDTSRHLGSASEYRTFAWRLPVRWKSEPSGLNVTMLTKDRNKDNRVKVELPWTESSPCTRHKLNTVQTRHLIRTVCWGVTFSCPHSIGSDTFPG